MWLAALLIAETFLLFYLLTRVGLLAFVALSVLYGLTYRWKSERTGYRRSKWFRGLSLWRKVGGVRPTPWNHRDVLLAHRNGPVALVIGPSLTGMGLFWGIGLHGDEMLAELDVLYTMPRVFFWIPLLRDVLLWSGAVLDSDAVVSDLLEHRLNVCVCPGGLRGAHYKQDENTLTVGDVPDAFLQACGRTNAILVPVVVHGEAKRYPRIRLKTRDPFNLIRACQLFFMDNLGYPFPLLVWPRWNHKMTVSDGVPVSASLLEPEKLKTTFQANWRNVGSTDGVALQVGAGVN